MKKIFICILGIAVVSGVCRAAQEPEIFAAVRSGSRNRVEAMIQRNKTVVWSKNAKGMNPFLTAVESGDLDMASLLADYFARIWESGATGNALHIAVMNEDEPMIKLVLKLAEEEDPELPARMINAPRSRKDDMSMTSSDRNTPLHLAARKCNARIYNYLVHLGARQDEPNEYRQTPRELIRKCPKEKQHPQPSVLPRAAAPQAPASAASKIQFSSVPDGDGLTAGTSDGR